MSTPIKMEPKMMALYLTFWYKSGKFFFMSLITMMKRGMKTRMISPYYTATNTFITLTVKKRG